MGAPLAPGKRTVSACLRMTGRADATNFTVYHQVLNRGRWKGRALARTLLDLVVAALVPEGPVIIGVDDTIERRWGASASRTGGGQAKPWSRADVGPNSDCVRNGAG